MARTGRPPQPTALKVLRGTARPDRINRQEPEPSPNAPEAPADLDDDARFVWDRVLREFGHTGVIRAADTDVFRLYCEAVARSEEAAKLLKQTGPLIRGARNGELVRNPLHSVVRDNAQLVVRLAAELGLTPSARTGLKHGSSDPKPPQRTVLEELQARRVAR